MIVQKLDMYFFSSNLRSVTDLSKDVFTLVKETPLEAVMIVQEMYVMVVTHGSTVSRTVMCRQDSRGRFPVFAG